MWTKMLIRNRQKKHEKTRKKIDFYFNTYYWSESIKQAVLWFLLQGVLIFTSNNMSEHSDDPLLKSMLKVFSFFKVQFQFAKDEVTEVSIQCNRCNKTVTCKFSETVTIDIFLVFIKAAVFHHVGLSWMILTKEKYEFYVEEPFIEWFTGGPWFNETIFRNLHVPIFEGLFVTACQF